MQIPVNSIKNVLEYLWNDEERHFSECDEGNGCDDHIFHELLNIRRWLESKEAVPSA